jgi:DNA-binding NtrC family response regulator
MSSTVVDRPTALERSSPKAMDHTTRRVDVLTRTADVSDSVAADTISLLVVERLSSRLIVLPNDGKLTIGRGGGEGDILLDGSAASRVHADLIMAMGSVTITDRKSHNGTFVNGERVAGSKELSSGDVIAIGEATLVLHAPSIEARRQPLDLPQLRARIDDELARAMEYSGCFALAVLRMTPSRSRTARGTAAFRKLRRMDSLGVDGESLVALLPELIGEAARSAVAQLVDEVKPLCDEASAGIATYPGDGRDAETLLAAARAAAAVATPGAICTASEATLRHLIGETCIVVADPAMMRLYELIQRLASSEISVLILGETGTGKEIAASALHHWSPRASMPFVTLNCSALPETLAESELFGYERGAFSEARHAKPGLLERAHGGTIFLDEVGELAPAVQAKLLRVLEQQRITRLGDVREREVNIRIVAATNRNLEAAKRADQFRSDLYHRLSAATVEFLPLRHRRREIPLLARLFVDNECARSRRDPPQLTESTLAALASYAFPGNVRELRNAMRFAVAMAAGSLIQPWDLPPQIGGGGLAVGREGEYGGAEVPAVLTPAIQRFRPVAEELRELERTRMVEALEVCQGVQTHAAAAIGMPIRTFTSKMKQYGIVWRESKR